MSVDVTLDTVFHSEDSILALSLLEVAMELAAIGPLEGTTAILQVVLPVASVRAAILESKDAASFLEVVLKLSVVF